MKKETEEDTSDFFAFLKKVNELIENEDISLCLELLNGKAFGDEEKDNEIMSLKAYTFILLKDYKKAIEILDGCLKLRPLHLLSKKRRALALERMGEYELSLKEFQVCLYMEPESKSLRNKVKRISMSSSKSESASSEGNTFDEKYNKTESIEENNTNLEEVKQKTQSVKFGSFQVIEITTQESDEHFALIKSEISKLSEKKPKKSILKDSTSSLMKEKLVYSESKIENTEKEGNDEEMDEKMEMISKVSLKKKSKSVTFKGDTNLEDFN